jgi:hypothetical protein
LGHNSKAVHRACAKRALMKIPSLEQYEERAFASVGNADASISRITKIPGVQKANKSTIKSNWHS